MRGFFSFLSWYIEYAIVVVRLDLGGAKLTWELSGTGTAKYMSHSLFLLGINHPSSLEFRT